MTGNRKAAWKRLAADRIGVVAIVLSGALIGYNAAPVKTRERTVELLLVDPDHAELDRLRKQLGLLTAQQESLKARLADTQRRLDACRHTIRRYQEELSYVDRLNDGLQIDMWSEP